MTKPRGKDRERMETNKKPIKNCTVDWNDELRNVTFGSFPSKKEKHSIIYMKSSASKSVRQFNFLSLVVHREMVSRTMVCLVRLNMSNIGPMGYTGIFWLIASRDSRSSSCTVLKIIPEVLSTRAPITLRMKDGSVVADSGRWAAWIGGRPGMKSIICCGSNDKRTCQI